MDTEPELLPAVEHIWIWFQQLNRTRGAGFGPLPITFQEILAWSQMTGEDPTPWEIERIVELDYLWLKRQSEEMKNSESSR